MAWLVPLLPLLAGAALALLARERAQAPPARRSAALVGAGAMAATAALAALASALGWSASLPWGLGLALGLDYAADPAAALFAVLVPAVAAPLVAYAATHEEARGLARLLLLLTASVAAMEVIAGAADLLALLVGWELIGACSWALVAHQWYEPAKPRAAIAVFLTTRAGDLGLFVALAAAFAGSGSLAYGSLGALQGVHLHLVVGGLLVAAASKSAQVPFAPWLFAAMEGPVSASALLHASTMVASGAFLLIRLEPVLAGASWFGPAALAVGLATALAAGTVALLQPHAKRLLAGSTSAHYGLMFVAVGAGWPAVAALHLVAHALAKAPLFLAAGVAHACAGTYRLPRLGVGRAVPRVAWASLVAAAALAGVPPLGAAWTKEEVVASAGHAGPAVAVLAMLAGALSAAYMARFHLQVFGRREGTCGERPPLGGERASLYALAAMTVLLGALWIPALHDGAADALGRALPSGKVWEVVLSLALVAGGLVLGRAVALRRPSLGDDRAGAAADWLGLPALARAALVRPGRGLCAMLARFDDAVMDGPARGVGHTDRFVAARLARFDDRVVDGAVRAAVALAAVVASAARKVGEAVFDGVPEGLADGLARGGRRARRLQTGLSHHYYALIVAGLAAVVLLLLVGR